ncbi:hypothetical protein [Microbacterium excoecariae]|uniref:hypothetical protein n=1 Tax=Microbacterium excoecariae TaxID=2715210 RepID=UPI00140C685C|nr:hypothetical protein [Microbacterium excoecariae]NHI16870.1 hypothetical protein [Microbacterium excoecariae]
MHDWHLSFPGTTLAFGTGESGFSFDTAPAISAQSVRDEDAQSDSLDGRFFGRDHLDGGNVTFEIDIMATTEEAARDLLRQARHAWRADTIRTTPGAVAALAAGSGRLAFGRPRHFVSNDDNIQSGVVRITADFATAEDAWYGPTWTERIPFVPAAGGGLVAPLAAPLSTTSSSDRSLGIVVGGELPTWPVFTVAGPITNPVIEVVGVLRLELAVSLAFDEILTVDTRPFARTVMRGSASVAGALSRSSTRLRDAAIPPGTHEVVLRGTSPTGTARLDISGRDAFSTP